MTPKRKERDSLGVREIPKQVYWGIQTLRALENFPVSGQRADPVFVSAYVSVKKACAMANRAAGALPAVKARAIVRACDEVLAGKFAGEFVVDVYQAGAGTSFNMNVNEVLANRALQILGRDKGRYDVISPNDHVNCGQSTNDTFPTASHIAIMSAAGALDRSLVELAAAFKRKSKELSGVVKSARTHLQDAVPITLGQEFAAYAVALDSARRALGDSVLGLRHVALGGSAVGTGLTTPAGFKKRAVAILGRLTGLPLAAAKDGRYALQSHLPLTGCSAALRNLALELIRISGDLRLLASGPLTGFAEIVMPAVQPGSSMMPGKVNPSLAEALSQISFDVVAADATVALAAQAGQLDLNVMTPVSVYRILHSIRILDNFLPIFTRRCVAGLRADARRCRGYFDNNPSLATVLAPKIGYLKAAELFKESLAARVSVPRLAVRKGILTERQSKTLFGAGKLTGGR